MPRTYGNLVLSRPVVHQVSLLNELFTDSKLAERTTPDLQPSVGMQLYAFLFFKHYELWGLFLRSPKTFLAYYSLYTSPAPRF